MEDRLQLTLSSFGFKYGPPNDVTHLWDVRFLPNPYWVEEMRDLTGMDPRVAAYVLDNPAGSEFLRLTWPLLSFLVEQNRGAGRLQMWLAIGCTGGQHRSVAVVERLARDLASLPLDLVVLHRDCARAGG
jgi:UPF0042 nucleotide-binding protein